MPNYVARIRIVDPDIVDRVSVEKRRTKNDAVVGKVWRLGNYQSTDDIDLEDGNFYLRLWPYFEIVDPLPVWFKIYNNGERKLIAKCVLSELQTGKAMQFKDLGIIESGKNFPVPACLNLEYRVLHFWLGWLDATKINGVTVEHLKKLVENGIVIVNDLLNKDKHAQISQVFGNDTATILGRAKLLCSLSINPDKFVKIEDRYARAVMKWSAAKVAKESGATQEDAKKLLLRLKDLSQALVAPVFEILKLKDLFGR
ncbi:MAG: hypothetical protein QME59_04350 [Candidatus Hydrothermarchaeota archaeon]|nr:hypothetical protein [Candidatus Hydrothermarchaeota archaeon]